MNLVDLENKLTSETRLLVQKYIYNCNEELFACMLLSPFNTYLGKPLSNAFYLHELTELDLFKEAGYDFINVSRSSEFREKRSNIYDTYKEPHLNAALLHCTYLKLKSSDLGYNLSLGTIVEYDPLTSRQDKNDLVAKDPSLKVIEEERNDAETYFISLAKSERKLFDQPFSLANFDRYRDVIFR
ncbi:MAG: hypothetical protein ACP5N1_06645 [Candidatus Woesearchaeota archaeon]